MAQENIQDIIDKVNGGQPGAEQGGQPGAEQGGQPGAEQGGQPAFTPRPKLGGDDPMSAQSIPGIDPLNPQAMKTAKGEEGGKPGEEGGKPGEEGGKPGEEGGKPGEEGGKPGEEGGKPGEEESITQFLDQLNTKAGTKFTSMDEVHNELNSAKTLRESELNYKSIIANHKNPLEEDKDLAKLYQFRKDTGLDFDDFNRINGKNLDEMSSIDKLVLQTVLSTPGLKGKEKLVRDSLNKTYGLNDDDIDESEKEMNQVQVDIAAGGADKYLRDLQSKITEPDFSGNAQITDEYKAQLVEDQKVWDETIPAIGDSFKEFPVYSSAQDAQDGKEPLTKIEIPDSVRSEYVKSLSEYAKANNIAPTKENVEAMNNFMYQDYISNNYLSIANAYADKKLEARDAMWKERTGQDLSKMKEQHVVSKKAGNSVADFNKSEVDKVLKGMPGR